MTENFLSNSRGELILLLAQPTKLAQPATQLEPNDFPPKLLGEVTGAELAGCPFCSTGGGQLQIHSTFLTKLACLRG